VQRMNAHVRGRARQSTCRCNDITKH
jgi:hypothetical protein